jgi:cardiolipin synthase
MEEMFLDDIARATEVVLERNHVHALGAPAVRRPLATSGSGSSGRVVAGAMRVGNTVAAAIANTRVLESVEADIAIIAGLVCVALSTVGFAFPRAIAFPLSAIVAWFAVALLVRGAVLYRSARKNRNPAARTDDSGPD